MAYRYTDTATRLVYSTARGMAGNAGRIARFWLDEACTQPVDLGLFSFATPDTVTSSTGSNQLVVGSDSLWPAMWDRAGTQDYVWVQVGTLAVPGTPYRVFADADQRLDELVSTVTTRTISTTPPLTGGGDLSQNRTIGISDATAVAKGAIQLAGVLSGTAASPQLANGAVTSSKILDGTIVNDDIAGTADIAQSKIFGLVTDLAGKSAKGAAWVNAVEDFAAPKDNTGSANVQIQQAIDSLPTSGTHIGGTVFLPVGTYRLTAPLVLKPGVSIVGAGRKGSRLSAASGAGVFTWTADISQVVIRDLYLSGAAGHIFAPTGDWGIYTTTVTRCQIVQLDTTKSIMNHVSAKDYDNVTFSDCDITRAAGSTVPGFNIINSAGAANQNRWLDCWAHGQNSNTAPFIYLESTSTDNYAYDNVIRNITGEQNPGGLVDARSAYNLIVENVFDYDASATRTKDLIRLGKSATGGLRSTSCTIRNSGRRDNVTLPGGIYDINCVPGEVLRIEVATPNHSSSTLKINASASADVVTILNMRPGALSSADPSTTHLLSGQVEVPGAFRLAGADLSTTLTGKAARLTTTTVKTSTYTAVANQLVPVDASAAPVIIGLPSAATAGIGGTVVVRKEDVTSNAVTVVRSGADTINGAALTVALTLSGETMTFVSDGTSKFSVSGGFKSLASFDTRYLLRGEAYLDSSDYATGNGTTDDSDGLEAWITAALGSSNPATNVRIPSKALYLSAGTYKITRPLEILSAMSVRMYGEGIKSILAVSGQLTYGLRLNGVAFSEFDNFEIQGLGGQAGTDTVEVGLSLEYDPTVAARTSTQNNFSRLQVRGLKYKTAYAFGAESGTLQVDQNTVYKCGSSGSPEPWEGDDTSWWQKGFVSGSGQHGNPLNHDYIGCVANGNRYNLVSDACPVYWWGGAMGYAEADLWHYGYTPASLERFRTESSNRLIYQPPNQSLMTQVSIDNVRFVAARLATDGYVLSMGTPGDLNIKNLVISEAGVNPMLLYTNNTGRPLNVTADGLRSRSAIEAFFNSSGSTAPLNVDVRSYIQHSAVGAPTAVTMQWKRAINSTTPSMAVDRVLGDFLSTGEVVPEVREITSNAISVPASGSLMLTYFTASKTETINTLTMWSGTSNVTGAAPTLIRYGVYEMAANGDLTLVASTTNDASALLMFAATNTAYAHALSAPWSKTAGRRYALGLLIVTAGTLPTVHGHQLSATAVLNTLVRTAPYYTGRLTAQTDLPASVTAGSMIGTQGRMAFLLS